MRLAQGFRQTLLTSCFGGSTWPSTRNRGKKIPLESWGTSEGWEKVRLEQDSRDAASLEVSKDEAWDGGRFPARGVGDGL